MNSKLLYILLFWGFILSGQLAEGQIRVIDNKGTVSSIDPSKWTRIGVTNDIYNKYPGNVGIGTTSPVATLHNGGSTILGMTTAINATATYTVSAASVDGYSGVVITQTVSTAAVTLTVPSNAIAGRRFTITNAASSTFPLTIGTYTLPIGTSGEFVWNGSAWSAPSSAASSATRLVTARSIYGGSFDGSADVTGVIASTYGGTGNGFAKFTGPTTTEKTFTLPNASATILTSASTVTVSQGGTGLTAIAANNLMYGTGTSAVSLLAPSATTGAILMNTTAGAPGWSLLSGLPATAGTLPIANGGTGLTSYTTGDLIYASSATALSKMPDIATGNALISGGAGVAPSWGKIDLAAHVTGIVSGANGGTGVANTGMTITLGGNLITSGANATTLTTTGTTNVTLPTSGTLVNSGVLIGITTLTTSSTSPYSPTVGTTKMLVYIVGGGGQGGGCAASGGSAGAGGGAGGLVIDYISHSGSTTYAFTVGAAGTSGGTGAAGATGAGTTFNGVTAGGGGGGSVGNATSFLTVAGGIGGTATGGDINVPGDNGGAGVRLSNTTTYGLAGIGASSPFGRGGQGRTTSTGAGGAATGYGAGGGGALGSTSSAGGAGTAGVIIIYEYK